MELIKAKTIAYEVVAKLQPFCERLELAGSIRRGKPFVHDIDIVCIPANQGQFIQALKDMGKIEMGGEKLIRVKLPSIDLDIYIATPSTWATLFLIRTGSKEHNIKLCSRAKSMGMKLHADGSGLFRLVEQKSIFGEVAPREERIAGDTEQSIFEALKLQYLEPSKRV
jgi:DNA polymerase/3'-5' exonuclease PolX